MENAHLIYVMNAKMPTNKAHGVHLANMCECFGRRLKKVTLIVPRRLTVFKQDPFEYYGVNRTFEIKKIINIDFVKIWPAVGYWVQYISFSVFSAVFLLFTSRKGTVIYTRDHVLAFIFKLLGFFTVYEAHRIIIKSKLFFYVVRKVDAIVTNSNGVAHEFKKQGFEHILSFPNGISPKQFDIKLSKSELRAKLNLPLDKKIILYSGHLYGWKGIQTVFESAILLKKQNFIFIFVGGVPGDVEEWKIKFEKEGLNAIFTGHKSAFDVPMYLKSADVLLLPNSAQTEESVKYTSPIKLFEYMASGIPIVASRLPSICEILNDNNAILFEADNASSLVSAITESFAHPEKSQRLATKALTDVQAYTWERRADTIISFVGNIYDDRL